MLLAFERTFEEEVDLMTAPTLITAPVLFARARSVLDEARHADTAAERFRAAHLAALRTAAIVLADRGRPAAGRKRLVSAWVLLDTMAPEYSTWATYFAAGAALRSAVEAGATSGVSQRLADDQLRAAEDFLAQVEQSMGLLAA